MALQSRIRKMMCFFASIEYNTIFVAQNELRTSFDVRSHFNQSFKSFKTFKSLRFVWWRMLLDLRNPPVEWMTRLCSYYEHLVLPDKSILGKHNYFGLFKSVTDWLVSVRLGPFIGRNTNPMCAPNTQSLQRNALVKFRSVQIKALPIIFPRI